jgi:hypothetical protein
MTTVEATRVSPDWLELRESADAAARSTELVGHLRRRLPTGGRQVVHDLGCGSGAMGRWLAPLLPGRQHWVLHDRDPDLLALAEVRAPGPAEDGAPVTVETRRSDVTRLGPDDLAGATLVTASALLDLLTDDELARLVGACTEIRCPLLVTLSVTGRVVLAPEDPLDSRVAFAFDAHQRRTTHRGRLLGPDAVDTAVDAFRRSGARVVVAPSSWQLGAREAVLSVAWLKGWMGAAGEQDAGLVADAALYRRRRLREARAGRLDVTVGHADLLVLP